MDRGGVQKALLGWLDHAAPSAERAATIRAELHAELDGGAATGMRPLVEGGELHLSHRYGIVVARKRHELEPERDRSPE